MIDYNIWKRCRPGMSMTRGIDSLIDDRKVYLYDVIKKVGDELGYVYDYGDKICSFDYCNRHHRSSQNNKKVKKENGNLILWNL
eukprot:UN07594